MSRPPGATRCCACATKSPRSENARDTTASNFSWGFQFSTRSQTTLIFASPSSVRACRRNEHFLWLESRSVTCVSGRAIAMGIPGSPGPVPTSSTVRALPRCGSTERLSRRCRDRKSTRLNSSHTVISYAVFCLKKKKKKYQNLLLNKKKKKTKKTQNNKNTK